MKVLVTGGSGLIGQYCLTQLVKKGYEVHVTSTQERVGSHAIKWHRVNLLDRDQTKSIISSVRPSHILHLAWFTEHGLFWESPKNLDWLQASVHLIREFTKFGGHRFVAAGTCAEYEWDQAQKTCLEEAAPLAPATLYGECKNLLRQELASWCRQTELSSAWGRIFSLYGPNEDHRRLVSSTIVSLLHKEKTTCGYPNLQRDYLHASDVASAFVALLESDMDGPINIGSGQIYTLGEIVQEIAIKLNAAHLVELSTNNETPSKEPDFLAPNIARLSSLNWTPEYNLSAGLNDTISWWSKQLTKDLRPSSV